MPLVLPRSRTIQPPSVATNLGVAARDAVVAEREIGGRIAADDRGGALAELDLRAGIAAANDGDGRAPDSEDFASCGVIGQYARARKI